jgi:hypothetical protein
MTGCMQASIILLDERSNNSWQSGLFSVQNKE